MNTNLLENIAHQFTPQMIQKVSLRLGEMPDRTQTAVDKAIPTLLIGLLRLSSLADGPVQLLDLMNHDNYGRLLNNLSGLCEEGDTAQNMMTAGQEILYVLFADKLDAVNERIAVASGVIPVSASALLSLTAPVVVGMVGRVRATRGLNAARLTTLLIGQKEAIVALAPAGLAQVLGVSDLINLGTRSLSAVAEMTPAPIQRTAIDPVKEKSTLKKWRWPTLGVVAIGVLYFLMGHGSMLKQSLMVDWQPGRKPAVVSVTLPSGDTLSLKEDSFNYNVVKFLADPMKMTVPKTFIFDHIHFAPGTAQFTSESRIAVEELSIILKAYPAVDVRLDGHTDDEGSVRENKELSRARAAVVRETLVRDGMNADHVTIAGYGQEYPLTSNETEVGRAKNQRMELVVLKK